jgi:hypothetical protein
MSCAASSYDAWHGTAAITLERLRALVGSELRYQGLRCLLVEVLDDPPVVVLRPTRRRSRDPGGQFRPADAARAPAVRVAGIRPRRRFAVRRAAADQRPGLTRQHPVDALEVGRRVDPRRAELRGRHLPGSACPATAHAAAPAVRFPRACTARAPPAVARRRRGSCTGRDDALRPPALLGGRARPAHRPDAREMGARLKYSAAPSARGSRASPRSDRDTLRASESACRACRCPPPDAARVSSATWRTSAGGSKGSSPCTLTTIASSAQPEPPRPLRSGRCRWHASSAVMQTSAPKPRQAAATS